MIVCRPVFCLISVLRVCLVVALPALTLLPSAGVHAAEVPTVTVNDLRWMTGYWSGPLGDQVMEENWNVPLGGTIAGLVRMAGPGGTRMIELVIIREHEQSLRLTLQQFNPDFSPQASAPQSMALVSTGERSVTFANTDESPGLKSLTYSRLTDDQYTIEAVLPSGEPFKAVLTRTGP